MATMEHGDPLTVPPKRALTESDSDVYLDVREQVRAYVSQEDHSYMHVTGRLQLSGAIAETMSIGLDPHLEIDVESKASPRLDKVLFHPDLLLERWEKERVLLLRPRPEPHERTDLLYVSLIRIRDEDG